MIFAVFKVILLIPVRYGAQDFTRAADGYGMRWDIAGHDAARADDTVLPNGDAGKDRHIPAYPDVVADGYGLAVLKTGIAQLVVHGMAGGAYQDVTT